ncbi:MAG: aldo/keto reductase [Cytophagales bacterium]
MELIKLGNSDLDINPIAFGAWAIGGAAWGGNDEQDSYDAICAAIDNELVTIDTAPIYGYGKSEEIIGKVIKDRGGRDQLRILTKFGINWNTNKGKFYFAGSYNGKDLDVYLYSGKDGVIKECEASLKRLQTDYIDLYQVHRPDPTTDISETMEALELLKTQGKIREGAVSNYNLEQLKKAVNHFPVLSNQLSYSMLERDIEKDIIPFCLEKEIGILAYSPLQRGILTGKYRGKINWDEDDHRKDTKWFQPENRERINTFLDKIEPIANDHGMSMSQLVINWTIRQKGITCTLLGGRNSLQVEQNIKSLDFSLGESEIQIIDKELSQLKLIDQK